MQLSLYKTKITDIKYDNQDTLMNETFWLYLTIDGTSFEEVEVTVSDPSLTIRCIIGRILEVFDLPKMDTGGSPVTYLLGKELEKNGEPEILEFEDENGREQSLLDHNIQPGDHLLLISVPVAGGDSFVSYDTKPIRNPSNRFRSIWSRIFVSKQDVYSSIFAPSVVKRDSHMLVQVFLHLFEETETIKKLAQESQRHAERRDYIPLQCKLKKGDTVDVQLNISSRALLFSEKKKLIWQGSFTKCSFDYFVPKNFDSFELICQALISVNGSLIGEMRFATQVSEYQNELNPKIHPHSFNKIFISYAHQDENKVEQMARAYRAQGVEYFFDRHYLKPGDVFPLKIQEFIDTADLFILCWSANAAKSEYVELERQRALKRAFPQVRPIEDAKLSIYPISIEPRAELPADMKDIYNFEVI